MVSRLAALEAFRRDTGFAQIVETFKRVSNILVGATAGSPLPNAATFVQPSEKKLVQVLEQARKAVNTAVNDQAWDKALAEIAKLQAPVAELFVAVMVNDPDLEVRKNRHALLQAVREVVLEVADFSAFQVS